MEVLLPGLRAVVTHAEYTAGIGKEFQELYITQADGKIMLRKLLTHGRDIIRTVDKLPVIKKDTLPAITPSLRNFFPNGEKIPYHLLEQIVSFFKEVMDGNVAAKNSKATHAYEAMAHIVWSPEGGYRIAIPTQNVTAAHVKYDWDHLNEGEEVILDIHSHNNMGAFFSGTDDGDDKNKIGFSGVVGHLGKPQPMLCWRFNDLEHKVECSLDDIFARGDIEVPKEWMDKVTFGHRAGGGYAATGYAGGAGFGFGKDRSLGKNQSATRSLKPVGAQDSILTGLEGVEDLTDGEYDAWCAEFFKDETGTDLSISSLAFREEMEDALVGGGIDEDEDISLIEYELMETPAAPEDEIVKLLAATPNRTLGKLEHRIIQLDPAALPDELLGMVELFIDQQEEAYVVTDLYFDMSEYFVFKDNDGGITIGINDGGWICNKLLNPAQAMAILQEEGPWMIADYDSKVYLVGSDMVSGITEEEEELGINITEGKYLGPLKMRIKTDTKAKTPTTH